MNYWLSIMLFFCAPLFAAPSPKLCGAGAGAIAGDALTRRFPFHTPIVIGDRRGLYLSETDTVVRVSEGDKIVEWKKSELRLDQLAALDKRGLDDAGREAVEASLANPGWWPKKIRDLEGMTSPTLYRLRDGTLAVQKRYGERIGSSWKDDPMNEAAAYSLDKKLGLGVVPPCIGNKAGSIQLYIEDANKGRWVSREEMALRDPIGTKRIRFLRSILIPVTDKMETLVDAQGKAWTYDFSRDHRLQNDQEITPERVLKDLPDYATYLRIKALEKAGFPTFGLEQKALLRKWISVVDPLIVEKGKDALFPY